MSNARSSTEPPAERSADLAEALLFVGEAHRLVGDRAAARRAWQAALAEWPAQHARTPREIAIHTLLLARSGDAGAAAASRTRLQAMGYRHPLFTSAMQQGG